MALDINMFISNKKNEVQKALAIIEIATSKDEEKKLSKKNNISETLMNDCHSIYESFINGKININSYERLNLDNYKSYLKSNKVSSIQ